MTSRSFVLSAVEINASLVLRRVPNMFEIKRAKSLISPEEAREAARREKKLAESKSRAEVLAERGKSEKEKLESEAKSPLEAKRPMDDFLPSPSRKH